MEGNDRPNLPLAYPLPNQRQMRETSEERKRRGTGEKAERYITYVHDVHFVSGDVSVFNDRSPFVPVRLAPLSVISTYVEEIRSSRREVRREEFAAGAPAGSAPINHRPARLRGQLSSAFASLIVRTCDPSAYTRGSPSPFVLYLSR